MSIREQEAVWQALKNCSKQVMNSKYSRVCSMYLIPMTTIVCVGPI